MPRDSRPESSSFGAGRVKPWKLDRSASGNRTAKIMTAKNPPLRQPEVDTTRAHALLTENPEYAAQLLYRYADTGETVSVPNVWYNQTAAYRVMCLLARAEYFRHKAETFLQAPDTRIPDAGKHQIAQRYLGRATEFENKAAALCLPVTS